MKEKLIDRDISWLTFNERLLIEAAHKNLPLAERLKFLSIYSSNLDEFSRVRIPAILAWNKIEKKADKAGIGVLNEIVGRQQEFFGSVARDITDDLETYNIFLLYSRPFPHDIEEELQHYFFTRIAGYIRVAYLEEEDISFFPENHCIYLAAELANKGEKKLVLVNIPSDRIPRFYTVIKDQSVYVVFIDDIIRRYVSLIWSEFQSLKWYSFKISRDAELNLEDEFKGYLPAKIEAKLVKRDWGIPARLLYDKEMPGPLLKRLVKVLALSDALQVKGGVYHNLKDLSDIDLQKPGLKDAPWKPVVYKTPGSLFDLLLHKDVLLHLPFHSYDTVLQFFNEAALDPHVTEINLTIYRISSLSQIAEAMISAALNGKKVTVFVELKARFDEANNIAWGKKMRKAGVKIIYSIPGMKVHAKVALVKRNQDGLLQSYGLVGTGNFNEVTAKFYTDHILLTSDATLLKDIDVFFQLLRQKKGDIAKSKWTPLHLLVSPFNLQTGFASLINREIVHAKAGRPSKIIAKFNNLEDKKMIGKLYEASCAGVNIQLIVRGICCLLPGVPGQSENITVSRIVDRYLEHGRIFYFHNNGLEDIYIGSSDWMTRNLYRRLEVCAPVYDPALKEQLKQVLTIYLSDNAKATALHNDSLYYPVPGSPKGDFQAQYEMYKWVKQLPGSV